MLKILIALILFASAAAWADVTTVYTLGPPTGNHLPALTQDGEPTGGLWYVDYVYDCALKQSCSGSPQASLEITLPNDPTNPGNRLFLNGCVGIVAVDTRPQYAAKTQQAPGVLQSTETCGTLAGKTWTGTITYNYLSVLQRHCSAGHPVCVSAYYPVLVAGSGTLTTSGQ